MPLAREMPTRPGNSGTGATRMPRTLGTPGRRMHARDHRVTPSRPSPQGTSSFLRRSLGAGSTILAMSLAVGQLFAGYTILRILGGGGMGNVCLASHPRLPREEALKVLPADFTGDAEYRARFVREADLAAGLSHPHIVGIHDRGETDGQFWISMEYVAGVDAAQVVHEQFPHGMPADEALPIITAVGAALDYAHHRGLLHRDVKPANVLLTEPGPPERGQGPRAILADFGIARRIDDSSGLTATNTAVGTAAYAAPEQLMGQSIDGRADQYALA